ncbi:MAG: hypothetical protein F6K56_35935 [Moorea sp. SIO3G5]|nr:hypothetical protein [Moorena sp. SIO3G5]
MDAYGATSLPRYIATPCSERAPRGRRPQSLLPTPINPKGVSTSPI